MRQHIRLSIAAVIAAAALAIGAVTSDAQPLPWNPPCTRATVINLSPCKVTIRLGTTPAGAIPAFNISPCATVVVPPAPPLPPGTTINGISTQALAFVPMVTPGPVIPLLVNPCVFGISALPADGWIRGVTLPPGGCCVDLYFYTTADPMFPCTIFVVPGTPPCTL